MKIPNYDSKIRNDNFKQIKPFMPNDTFRMLICGPSGSGKTNTLIHMLIEPLLYFDKIYLYTKNLEQDKYRKLLHIFQQIKKNKNIDYEIIEARNDNITPVSELPTDNQKIAIFDDFVTEKNQTPLINYFIQARHKNCSAIYLSQSYYKTPKDIRINCTHLCIYDLQTKHEKNLVCKEYGIKENVYKNATNDPYSFIYINLPKKTIMKNFNEPILN